MRVGRSSVARMSDLLSQVHDLRLTRPQCPSPAGSTVCTGCFVPVSLLTQWEMHISPHTWHCCSEILGIVL